MFTDTGGSSPSRITGASATGVSASSIELSYTAMVSATRYKIFYTTDGTLFYPVPPPTGYCKSVRNGVHAYAHTFAYDETA